MKLLWVNLSILVFGALLLELGAGLYYAARTTISAPNETAEWVDRIPADAYADRSWLLAGFTEEERIPVGWTPLTYWRRQPFSGTYLNVDEKGLRRTWNAQSTDPVRIYMFGGSTLWGTGSRDDFTIPSYLSKALAERFPAGVQVVNYGETGYVNTQEMITLFRELQAGRPPAIVVFYDGYNDTFATFQNRAAGIPNNEFKRYSEFNILHESRRRDFFREVVKHSNLYQLMQGARAKLVGAPAVASLSADERTKLVHDLFSVYGENIRMIEAVGKEARFAPIFYWQPSVYSRPERNEFERSWIEEPEQARFFEEMYASVKRSPLTASSSFHDISDVFAGQQGTLYIDFAHTTERANQIIAQRIYQDVAPLVAARLEHP